ncbi:hypothetical protein L6452_13805 [Arctium lappa]|uniref:Uncharacterized protein n=1 Tax=Arctium lappa TaxID=4217 RepID=A0ACB9CJB1_ARCLA|nr:hypothetical protein L6452_13805 [Arctium lappa]
MSSPATSRATSLSSRYLVASGLQDVIHLRHLFCFWFRSTLVALQWRSIKHYAILTVHIRREQKEGGCVWPLSEIWSIRYVASLSTIWSIFFGDMWHPYSSAIWSLIADRREMDVLSIWSMWFHLSLFPLLFCL